MVAPMFVQREIIKAVQEAIAKERERCLNAAIAIIKPENVMLGHTWLKRMITKAIKDEE